MTNTNIVFRTKFEKVVTEQNKEVLQKAFESFCSMASGKAIWLLWRLGITANSVKDGVDAAPKYASEFLTHFGLDSELIQLENLDLLRSELRYQYEQKNPNFLAINAWDEFCKSAYEELKNKTDSIVAYIVYTHCVERVYVVGMDRVFFLLNSDEEKNYFGGIRSLNFAWFEANYLKPFKKQIYELFKAMYEYRRRDEAEIRKNNPFALPSVSISEEIAYADANEEEEKKAKAEQAVAETEEQQEVATENEELPTEKAPESKAGDHENQEQAYVPLTIEVVLENQELFRAFLNSDMNVLLKIGNLGLDLNEVMAKKEKISALLDAIRAFSE